MPVFWDSISFMWALAGIGALALVFGVRTWFAYRRLARDASDDWDCRKTCKICV